MHKKIVLALGAALMLAGCADSGSSLRPLSSVHGSDGLRWDIDRRPQGGVLVSSWGSNRMRGGYRPYDARATIAGCPNGGRLVRGGTYTGRNRPTTPYVMVFYDCE